MLSRIGQCHRIIAASLPGRCWRLHCSSFLVSDEPLSQTIFAPCTVGSFHADRSWGMSLHAPSAVCVIRISGSDSLAVLRNVTLDAGPFIPNKMYVRSLYRFNTSLTTGIDRGPKELLDHNAMVVYFKGPQSFTGEDVVELHVHGGRAVVQDVMDRLMELGNHIRPADPGEFTKRAFLNGKMDLTQIEGLSDVLSSQTKAQKDMALAQAMGLGKHILSRWRQKLISCIASVEAVIDFGEDDIEPGDVQRVLLDTQKHADLLRHEIQKHIDAAPKSEIIKEGIRVVLIGPPNVGKSSLLNTMVGRSAAIVSPKAGTTRDILEATLDIAGHKAIVQDGAGVRHSKALEEAEGISRILAAAEKAHILVVVSAVNEPRVPLDDRVRHVIQNAPRVLYVKNKDDLRQGDYDPIDSQRDEASIPISCHTGKGVDVLINALEQHFRDTIQAPTSMEGGVTPILHRSRHIRHMQNAVRALESFHRIDALELAAEELRFAVTELGYVTGTVDLEDILDSVFKEFCIGK